MIVVVAFSLTSQTKRHGGWKSHNYTSESEMREQTWEISDIDGSNKRTVTLAQYRAELEAAKAKAIANYQASMCKVSKERQP